ncbi:MAG TPA: hypothetical protein PKC25_05810, partial [Candidatus Rifleibacterium sp.]|nr:hypothetical protein [Candidatus Rifleibacterium sp.]
SRESIASIRELYKVFFRSEMNVSQVMEKWSEFVKADDPHVAMFHDFVKKAKRGVYKRTRRGGAGASEE